jgi:hypothetical protein
MKQMILVFLSLCLFTFSAQAKQKPVQVQSGSAVQPCPMMSNMQMPCPMSGVMQSMIDVMKIEQKLLSEIKDSDKKALRAELDQKMAALEKQMADMKCCMPMMQNAPAAGGNAAKPCPMQNGQPCTMKVTPLP